MRREVRQSNWPEVTPCFGQCSVCNGATVLLQASTLPTPLREMGMLNSESRSAGTGRCAPSNLCRTENESMASSVAALLIDDRIYHSHAGEWPPKCYRDQLAPVRFCLAHVLHCSAASSRLQPHHPRVLETLKVQFWQIPATWQWKEGRHCRT